ncbi:CBS domain-containing protein [Porticoccus sp. W117]|uniref:CBS domain-containing protein n=1 Tax=Porticoccus sp. W117 TaxID=3054777 RepID=UPI0025913E94|nr:CBS domain-containing protein [Porticoccus sp. W117]MDM3872111.1 CBS domain-containing protein [Porticoccus sp. W117]
MQSLRVKDYMELDSHSIPSTLNVAEAVDVLLNDHLSGAPVVDRNRQLVGFLSEKDCIKHLINSSYYRDGSPSVEEIMNRDVISVAPDTSILELAEVMLQHAPKIYPVCDNGKLIGVIQRHHVLQALRKDESSVSLDAQN